MATATNRRILQPPGWPRPKGYSNGILAEGRLIFVGGQVGWDSEGRFPTDFASQLRQALANILAVLAEAGGGPQHIVRLTWYVRDMDEYSTQLPAIGETYRAVMGRNYPTMAVIAVTRFVEPEAKLEIEATAVLPHS
jgi:enamine deaminase RidA (YjgF/YER057c/UK114 family)